MPATCHYCEVKLFGNEVAAGVCEHCEVSPAPRRRFEHVSPPHRSTARGAGGRPGVSWGLLLLC
jgi:hypothetical protein